MPSDLEAVGVPVGGERPRPSRPAEEEVAVPLHVAQLDAARREVIPGPEDLSDERGLELRAADEVPEDVAEEDDGRKAPGDDLLEGRKEVLDVSGHLPEVGVGEDRDPPLLDPPRLRKRNHGEILSAADTSTRRRPLTGLTLPAGAGW